MKKKDPISLNYGKVPPQAIDLEEVVLGAAMLEPEGTEIIMRQLSSDAFYKHQHQLIFDAISRIYQKDQPVDILTVTEQLRSMGKLDECGGPYYITTLTDRVASSANTEFHAAIIRQKYIQRLLIIHGDDITRQAYEDTTEISELMDRADRNLQKVMEVMTTGKDASHVTDLIRKSMETLLHREEMVKSGKMSGVPTGIIDLNTKTNGWQKGDLIIWASRPGMGKTASMLKQAIEAAKSGVPVCIYSLEMTGVRLVERLIMSLCDIDPERFRSGYMRPEDWDEYEKGTRILSGLPIYVDDNPIVSMRYIKNHARMMQKRGRCSMVMIDYLQLADMRCEEKGRSREQEVSQASREAKIIAKSLNIPVHLLAQLSRASEKRGGDMKPILSDLRESGAIEQDADLVIFIYRPEYYGIDEDGEGTSTKGVGEFIIAKNREGALGIVPFKYNRSLTKIWDYSPDLPGEKIPPNESFEYKMDLEIQSVETPF